MSDKTLQLSDHELAERTRTGNSVAYGELWRRHAQAGRAAARKFHSIADADDIVSEAYLRILRALQSGGGPSEAFRPYLYRTVHNVALSWGRSADTKSVELPDGLEADGPSLEETVLENTIMMRAFRSLPERWQTILWYTEVEGMEPAEAALFLGLTANSAAALGYRAREGLKKAWLQAHVGDQRISAECRWTTERMGDYNRKSLSSRAKRRFEQHLNSCTHCSILVEEIDEVSGRIAVMLVPLLLGGAVGWGVLTELNQPSATTTASASTPTPPPRHTTGASRIGGTVVSGTASIVGAAVIATAGFVLPALLESTRKPQLVTERSGTAVTPAPDPNISAQPPTAPAPLSPAEKPPPALPTPREQTWQANPVAPAPKTQLLVVPVPAPTDTTTRQKLAIISPLNGAFSNTAYPTFTGTGEPGSLVQVQYLESSAPLSTTVAPDGTWQLQAATAVPDGTRTFTLSQIDPAGDRSLPETRTLTTDTVALPPTVAPLPSPLLYLPEITGTAEPRATVQVRANGTTIARVVADTTGSWSLRIPDPEHDGTRITATQIDVAGNMSTLSAPTAPLTFERPTLALATDGATIPSTAGITVVTLHLTGVPGTHVQALIDGIPTGNIHTLQTAPIDRLTPPLTDGPHTIGARYIDQETGRAGSMMTLTFKIET